MYLGLTESIGTVPDGDAGCLFLGLGWFTAAKGLAWLDA